MAVSRKRRKRAKPETVDPRVARKRVLSGLTILLLLAALSSFIAIYSYTPLSEADLKTVEITLKDVQEDSLGRKAPNWVLITSTQGDAFYYNRHINGSADAITYLKAQTGNAVTIGYTDRLECAPPFLYFLMGTNGTKRVVTASYNGNEIYTLGEFNAHSATYFGIWLTFAVILILIAAAVVWFSRQTLFPKKKST